MIEAAIREKGLLVDMETRLNQVVGGRLRERRSAAGLTLKQLANRTGLSVSLISQIELGKSAASMSIHCARRYPRASSHSWIARRADRAREAGAE